MTSPQLRLVAEAVALAWRAQNRSSFGNSLRPCTIQLAADPKLLGRWDGATRTLTLATGLVLGQPWAVVVEVLRHEMAHQFVTEVLRVEEPPHGPTFRAVCRQRGIDPAAAGLPVSTDPSGNRVLEKVRKLLALASSHEPHEAESALRAAHRLLRDHAMTLGDVEERRYGFLQVGPVRARRPTWEQVLAGILAGHFFVRAVYIEAYDVARGSWGRVLELSGTAEQLQVAEYVYGWLAAAAEGAWMAHPRRRSTPGGRERFLAGVMTGFKDKLKAEDAALHERGLVRRDDPVLEAWIGLRHPNLVAGRSLRVRTDDAWVAGREAGARLELRKGVQGGPGPRALTDRRGRR